MKKNDLSAYKKMTPEELQGYLAMRRRNFVKKNKRGKGSYDRKKRGDTPCCYC